MDSSLPAGWTIERVRALSGDRTAALLSPERLVVVDEYDQADYSTLRPDAVISFHDLCLVWAAGTWFMGHLEPDGSVICWASYGPDLYEAVRAL
ncbi:hypothetical protein [Marinitenerispora sediminis]|uniref:Uncharacterized protein n=1 Tax=Marinitenerispora sediminis TaxID=1931232 RepID=A0A368SZ29_9ACTN|nr:hypothetical protein [Marinitenerispora sediminis]RCV47874.1 hypothetical protein DEF28_25140 [Marinitenerispora sediminis]RCV48726.1 hypothetical protein DEF23_24605 [Marinitenerispora sediminis]RCV50486.1 hypothetical protein DEF24_24195 [Marinitenerispora sediminis]